MGEEKADGKPGIAVADGGGGIGLMAPMVVGGSAGRCAAPTGRAIDLAAGSGGLRRRLPEGALQARPGLVRAGAA
jgi:hypothetical protein